MVNEMLLMVPSRGRPQNIKRLCEALINTDTEADLIVGIDQDDPTADSYQDLANEYKFHLRVSPERKRFAATVNSISVDYYDSYRYLAWMGDDHVPHTLYWDQLYINALKDVGAGVVYGNDLVMSEAIATELAFTSNIVKALGYAIPEGFIHLYVDNYFMELGKTIGNLIYLPDVIVQHMHPTVGAAHEDQTYREANSSENWTNDRIRYERYLQEELYSDAEKIRRMLNDTVSRG